MERITSKSHQTVPDDKQLALRPARKVIHAPLSQQRKGNKQGQKKGPHKVGMSKGQMRALFQTQMVPGPLFPPQFGSCPTYRVKRRWTSNENDAITSASFRIAEGHNSFLIVDPTTTATLPFVDSWRIRKVSIWTNNYVDNPTTATLSPAGFDIDTNNFNDREQAFCCSSRGENQPGVMHIEPGPDTPMGDWHNTTTVNSAGPLFILNVDYGGASTGNWATVTMDIDFEFVLGTFGGPKGYTKSLGIAQLIGAMGGLNWTFAGLPIMLLQGINVLG